MNSSSSVNYTIKHLPAARKKKMVIWIILSGVIGFSLMALVANLNQDDDSLLPTLAGAILSLAPVVVTIVLFYKKYGEQLTIIVSDHEMEILNNTTDLRKKILPQDLEKIRFTNSEEELIQIHFNNGMDPLFLSASAPFKENDFKTFSTALLEFGQKHNVSLSGV